MSDNDQVAYATDKGLLAPTALSLYTALRHSSTLKRVHLLASGLESADVDIFKTISADHGADIEVHSLSSSLFSAAQDKDRHVPKTALARLFLPKLTSGKVLYIDGDTIIRRDLRPLVRTDLGGKLIAGVRDYGILKRVAGERRGRLWSDPDNMRGLVAPEPVEDYINSGVILMDCDAIRNEPGMLDRMTTFEDAARYKTVDQDFINKLFKGRIHHLDPVWNSSWGRHREQAKFTSSVGINSSDATGGSVAILHFHGPHKPWRTITRAMLKRGTFATLAFRAEMRRFRRRYPMVTFL